MINSMLCRTEKRDTVVKSTGAFPYTSEKHYGASHVLAKSHL